MKAPLDLTQVKSDSMGLCLRKFKVTRNPVIRRPVTLPTGGANCIN